MSGFLSRLVQRTLGRTPLVRPLIPAITAPDPDVPWGDDTGDDLDATLSTDAESSSRGPRRTASSAPAGAPLDVPASSPAPPDGSLATPTRDAPRAALAPRPRDAEAPATTETSPPKETETSPPTETETETTEMAPAHEREAPRRAPATVLPDARVPSGDPVAAPYRPTGTATRRDPARSFGAPAPSTDDEPTRPRSIPSTRPWSEVAPLPSRTARRTDLDAPDAPIARSREPHPLGRPLPVKRSSAPAPDAPPGRREPVDARASEDATPIPAAPTVAVSIGRIEVRVAAPPRPAARAPASATRPAVDLGEFLRRRESGRRE